MTIISRNLVWRLSHLIPGAALLCPWQPAEGATAPASAFFEAKVLPVLPRLPHGMNADNAQHADATLQCHTGTFAEVSRSMGAGIRYGLGTENAKLPSFVSIQGGGVCEDDPAFLHALIRAPNSTCRPIA